MNTTATSQLRTVTLGKAATRHASHYTLDDKGRPARTGFPICGTAQGRRMQGTRPVNHVSFDLDDVNCTKCCAALAG